MCNGLGPFTPELSRAFCPLDLRDEQSELSVRFETDAPGVPATRPPRMVTGAARLGQSCPLCRGSSRQEEDLVLFVGMASLQLWGPSWLIKPQPPAW